MAVCQATTALRVSGVDGSVVMGVIEDCATLRPPGNTVLADVFTKCFSFFSFGFSLPSVAELDRALVWLDLSVVCPLLFMLAVE
jgi:hypothetical protein